MDLYGTLVSLYDNFLSIFPAPLQWVVTLLVLIALVMAFIGLIRRGGLFLILIVILLPILIPVLRHFLTDLYNFFLFLVSQLKTTAPR